MGLAISLTSLGQVKEGKIIYDRTMQMPSRIFANLDPEVAAKIPKSRTEQYELLFGNGQSLYQFLPTASNEESGATFGGGGMIIRMSGGGNDIIYHNFEKAQKVEQRELMDRNYVITDSIRAGEWKLTDETRKILNYTARKAIGKRISQRRQMSMENGEMKTQIIPDTAVVVAWFTTEIPVPVGPEMQGQLPGAILELDINNGEVVYKAIEFSPKVNVSKIKEPKDGKKMSQAEFALERDKVMEEMRKNMPAGRTMRITN